MITIRTLVDFISAEPFQPFRIHMASGRSFDIRHPEMIDIGRSKVTVYMYPEDEGYTGERRQLVSYLLMESIEPLATPAKQESK